MKRLLIGSILLLSVSAVSAADLKDISIYGSVMMGTWLDKTEKFLDDKYSYTPPWDTIFGPDTRPDYQFNILPYGNLGIRFKGNKIGATFEMGVQRTLRFAYVPSATLGEIYRVEQYSASIRRFFAEWYINGHLTFLVGQDYVPICFFSSNQMYYDNNSFGNSGSLYGGRKPMLEMIYSNFHKTSRSGIEAKLAAIRVDTIGVPYTDDLKPIINSKFPKFETSFEGKLNNGDLTLNGKIAGGFQQFDLARQMGTNSIYYIPDSQIVQHINCYVGGIHASARISSVSLKTDFSFGQNFGVYGLYIGNPFVYRGLSLAYLAEIFNPSIGTDITTGAFVQNNNRTQMADVIAGLKATPWLSFEAGIGWVHATNGDSTVSANWHDMWSGYFQSEIKIKEIVVFTPEIGMYYYGPKWGYGRMFYAGFGTRFDF